MRCRRFGNSFTNELLHYASDSGAAATFKYTKTVTCLDATFPHLQKNVSTLVENCFVLFAYYWDFTTIRNQKDDLGELVVSFVRVAGSRLPVPIPLLARFHQSL